MNSFSGSLYATPSFIEGASRVLDIGCTLDCYNMDLPPDQLDLLAIHSDWLTVGQDLWATLNSFDIKEHDRMLQQSIKSLRTLNQANLL